MRAARLLCHIHDKLAFLENMAQRAEDACDFRTMAKDARERRYHRHMSEMMSGDS